MYSEKYNTKSWNPNEGEDFAKMKTEILNILKAQKYLWQRLDFYSIILLLKLKKEILLIYKGTSLWKITLQLEIID